jgi:hypothetical protein
LDYHHVFDSFLTTKKLHKNYIYKHTAPSRWILWFIADIYRNWHMTCFQEEHAVEWWFALSMDWTLLSWYLVSGNLSTWVYNFYRIFEILNEENKEEIMRMKLMSCALPHLTVLSMKFSVVFTLPFPRQ